MVACSMFNDLKICKDLFDFIVDKTHSDRFFRESSCISLQPVTSDQ